MSLPRHVALLLCCLVTRPASAQTPAAPPPPPPPLWDAQIGASFVGTSGNSDTASTGADFIAHRRGLVWQIESAATAVRTNSQDVTTAERYLGMLRAQRRLTPIVGLSSGIKLERDRFSGLDLRSILDGGLSWALVHHPEWTLDGVTSVAWLHESRTADAGVNDPIGVLQLLSRIPFGGAGDTTQRFTYYPDFKTSSGLPLGSRDHRAGSDERPPRAQDRLSPALLERPRAGVQENRQHDDRVGGVALEGGNSGPRAVRLDR